MTVTNAHNEATANVKSEVIRALEAIGMEEQDNLMVSPDGKIKLSLNEQWFKQYSRDAGYDEAYQNIYLVPTFQ